MPAAALLGLSLSLGGCSSTPSYCDEVSATKSSFETLVNTDVLSEGTDALQQNYDAFSAQLDSLVDAAGDEFAEETAAVESSLQQVAAVLDDVADLNLGAAVQQAGPALESVKTSTQALLDSIQTKC